MFQVEWKEQARDELTSLWLSYDAESRRVITETVEDIDRTLARAADTVGESRSRLTERIYFHLPLGVLVEVVSTSGRRSAVVVHVWPIYKTNRGG